MAKVNKLAEKIKMSTKDIKSMIIDNKHTLIVIGIFIVAIILFVIFFPRNKDRMNNNLNQNNLFNEGESENFYGMGLEDKSLEPYMDGNQNMEDGDINNLVTNKKPSFVLFYAPWCGHCKKIMPEYQELIRKYNNSNNIQVFRINCDENEKLARDNDIQGYPTIKFYPIGMQNKARSIEYNGDRSLEGMQRFIDELHSQ